MSIISDYKDIGNRYHHLSDGWIPVESASKTMFSKEEFNERYGAVTPAQEIRSLVGRIMSRKRTVEQLDDQFMIRLFEAYNTFVLAWVQGNDYFCPNTGLSFNREAIDGELCLFEKHSKIDTIFKQHRFRLKYANWLYEQYSRDQKPVWNSDPHFKSSYKSFFEAYALAYHSAAN